MGLSKFCDSPVLDCHVHLWLLGDRIEEPILHEQEKALLEVIDRGHLNGMYIFAKLGHATLYMKARNPGVFYAGGYAPWTGEAAGFHVEWQSYIQSLIALGYDGVGEMGSKPVTRARHVPLDSEYYRVFWDSCEAEEFPVLCHVGDVEDFWHEDLTPEWAKVRGWGYWKGDYPRLEELYVEIENVLDEHPGLKVVLCHLLFMSPNLERLDEFFQSHRNANVDLSLGVELIHNISRRPDEWRAFIRKHDDRFLMGTDIGMSTTLRQHLARIWLLRNLIESDEEFYTPDYADDLLTRYKEPFIGLNLPGTSRRRIYSDNYRKLWGAKPRDVDINVAIRVSEEQGCKLMAKALKSLFIQNKTSTLTRTYPSRER